MSLLEPKSQESRLEKCPILLVDDNQKLCRQIETRISVLNETLEESLILQKTFTAEGAIKRLKLEDYKLILVDLRLKPGEEGKDAGLRLIEQIANQTKATIILFTSVPHDPLIGERINKATEKYSNFPFFVGDKADSNTLVDLIEAYLQKKSHQGINYHIISPDLIETLKSIGTNFQRNHNKRYYEDGEKLFEARKAIEKRRKDLQEEINQASDSVSKKQLEEELSEISKLWASWLSEYVPIAQRTITVYLDYYMYFSDQRFYPYREKVNITSFRELVRRESMGQKTYNPSILSGEEQLYLLKLEPFPDFKQIRKITTVRKHYPKLPFTAVYRLSFLSKPLLDVAVQDLQKIPSPNEETVEELINEYQEKGIGNELKEKFLSLTHERQEVSSSRGQKKRDLSDSLESVSSEIYWQKKNFYQYGEATLEKVLNYFAKNKDEDQIATLIFDSQLTEVCAKPQIVQSQLQIVSLPTEGLSLENLDIMLENFLFGLSVKRQKILLYVTFSVYSQIEKILSRWWQIKEKEPVLKDLLMETEQKNYLYVVLHSSDQEGQEV